LRRHIREALAHRAIQITGPNIIGYLRAVIVLLVGTALARTALTRIALTGTALFAIGARAVSATSALRTPRSSRLVSWTAPLLRVTPSARAAAFPRRIMRIVSTSPCHVHPRSAYHGFTPRQLRLYRCCGAAPSGTAPRSKYVRRRPTLPRGRPRSTIGAEGLNFRVRNVAGCFPFAMAAETLWRYQSVPDRISGTSQWTLSRVVRNKPSAY